MPRLALLDGHSLAFRAFYALPADLSTPDGRPTNAVFGFTSMVIKLLGDEHPEAMAVAWDTPSPPSATRPMPATRPPARPRRTSSASSCRSWTKWPTAWGSTSSASPATRPTTSLPPWRGVPPTPGGRCWW